jgi:hypothetical protein
MIKTKKKSPASISQLKKKADAVFSKYIRYRDGMFVNGVWGGNCITCGQWFPHREMQAGHFQSRRFNITRFDEMNVNGQCRACNVFRHGEQYKYAIAVDEKYGEGTAERLARKSMEFHKFTVSELQGLVKYYGDKVKEYEHEGGLYA